MKMNPRWLLLLALALPTSSQATVYYVSESGSNTTGTSWATAFQMLDAALAAAQQPGDEIWVTPSTQVTGFYYQPSGMTVVTLKDGVSLYGGFAGNETSRDQRNPGLHDTQIQYSINVPLDQDLPTVISGMHWTLSSGAHALTIGDISFGGHGALASGNHLTITGNFLAGVVAAACNLTLQGNTLGGSPFLQGGDFKFLNNVIWARNSSGFPTFQIGALGFPNNPSNGVAANNMLLGVPILDFIQGTRLINNTVVGSDVGISIENGGVTIVNNIIAYNTQSGLYENAGGNTERNNLFFSNPRDIVGRDPNNNQIDMAKGAGDITSDPRFVDQANGDLHLVNGSPAINAGDDSLVQAGWLDADGHARVFGAHVDLGAYESGSNSVPAARVIYVNAASAGGNGTSWATAFQTLKGGLDAAQPGDEVWVAAVTTYPQFYNDDQAHPDVLKDGVSLYGGFTGTETSRDQRDPKAHVTTFASGLIVPVDQDLPTVISGMYFYPGTGVEVHIGNPTGLSAATGQLLTIEDNTFEGGFAVSALTTYPQFKCNCTIQRNTFTQSGGPLISRGAPKILDNIISGNGAIWVGELGWNGIDSAGAVVANNVLLQGGIIVLNTGVLIANNTVVGSAQNAAMDLVGGVTVVNNIIALNANIGLRTGNPIIENHNLVYGNGTDYSNLTPDPSDIHVDPQFANLIHPTQGYYGSDLHLTAASPAVNAGSDSQVQAGWLDADGHARVHGAHVDLGAYEFGSTGNQNQPPQVNDPVATPNPVSGTTTNLSVTATDPDGDSLSYQWAIVGAVPATPAFSAGTSASTTVTFIKAGTYTFHVTVSDGHSHSVTSNPVTVTVNSTVTGIGINPSEDTVLFNTQRTLNASIVDQFGDAIGPADSATTWSLSPTGTDSSISPASGASTVFSAGATAGVYTVTAQSGSFQASAQITVAAALPVLGSITPNAASQGDPAFSLAVTGDHFTNPPPTVRWNGQNRTTHFVSVTQLTADITAADLSVPGQAQVTLAGAAGSLPFDIVEVPGTPDLGSLSGSGQHILPLNATLQVHATGRPAQYVFVFTPQSANSPAPSRVLGRAAIVSYTAASLSGSLALGNVSGLAPGNYTLTVTALNRLNRSSSPAQASITLVISNLDEAHAYPNPWRADLHAGKDVTFVHLPLGSTIKIFTVSGHWVKTLNPPADTVAWDLTNNSGDKVASGNYLYLITTDSGSKKTGQVVVIK